MKSRTAAAAPEKSTATWIVVPLAALTVSGVLGMALFGGGVREPEPSRGTLSGGPGVERPAGTPGPSLAPSPPPSAAPIAAAAPMTLASASRMVPIEVYTASWCTACATAERWMDANDIAYSEIDVDRNAGARAQLVALNPRRTLPTFDVAGDVLVGFDPGRLGAAIEGAARRRTP